MATKKPWWLKQRRFAIPSVLAERIKDMPEGDRLFYCYIVNKIRYETREDPTQFEGIHSTYFQNFIGSGYRRYLEQLRDWRIVQILEHYQNNDGQGFPKAYRLHGSALETPLIKVRFSKKKAQPLTDHSKVTDEVTAFVLTNCRRVGVTTDLVPQATDDADVDAEQSAEQVFCGQFNVRYGRKVHRIFHTIIEMRSTARANLRLKDDLTLPLCEYDVKSCHPVLLLSITEDPKEKERLTGLLTEDFYGSVANESNVKKDRDIIKKDFLKFANGSIKNYWHRYFTSHFPKLTQYLNEHKGGVAAFGQNAEALIMVDEVPRWLMASAGSSDPQSLNILKATKSSLTSWGESNAAAAATFYIPMHDGWLGIEKDELRIGNYVRDRIHEYTQFWVTITKKNLTTGEEAILLKGPPVLAVEPPTIHR